jgi:biopolymer transport protein ExbD
MKFPRNARIFRGQLDAAPFVSVFFLLVIFVVLGKYLYVPGIQVKLPTTENLELPGPEGPTISVAVTTNAIYFRDKAVPENDLSNQLSAARREFPEPPTLILQVDRDVTEEKWMRLVVLARQAGITNLLHATFPRVYDRVPAAEPKP